MFGKKCDDCGEKVSGKYSFCPYCGNSTKKLIRKDFGMLGENDADEPNNFVGESFMEKMMGKAFESAIKIIEKEVKKQTPRTHQNSQPRGNFQLFINGKRMNINDLRLKKEQKTEKEEFIELPNEPLKDFQKFPKKEPKTNVRRFSDKVVYEVSMPGIKSEEDISIVNLENSIEIKGVGKKTSYQKILPVDLPIIAYNLSKGKLILELGLKE